MNRNSIGVACAVALGLAFALESVGQDTAREQRLVRIREIEGMGKDVLVNTPVYSSSVSTAPGKRKEWGQILVEYQTADEPEWMDTIGFRYHVLLVTMSKDKKREFVMLRGDVQYVDVQGGEEHFSSMFIRPQTIERYGLPVAVHVRISPSEGEATEASVSERVSGGAIPDRWWENDRLEVKDGLLYNRAQSPFALIEIDRFETIQK